MKKTKNGIEVASAKLDHSPTKNTIPANIAIPMLRAAEHRRLTRPCMFQPLSS